ncbi:MAG: HAMP domain-containing sensor histidine kinase [Chloroflexota bacterium]
MSTILSADLILAVVVAGFYTLLLLLVFTRRVQKERQTRWLVLYLALSILWVLSLIFEADFSFFPFLSRKVLLLTTTVLGVTTAVYGDWPQPRNWFILGSSLILLTIGADLFFPEQYFFIPNLPDVRFLLGTAVGYGTWAFLGSAILIRTWRHFRNTRFPLHANRLLFWFVLLLAVFAGELLTFIPTMLAHISGHIIRFLAIIGLAYAATSHRIFDVRSQLQNTIAFIIITELSALPIIGAALVLQRITPAFRTSTTIILTIVIITIGFALYQPFYTYIKKIVDGYILEKQVETSKVLQGYSQAISKTLDVTELSRTVIQTLDELLGVNRGALMLITRQGGGFQVQPVPGMGTIAQQKYKLPDSSLFIYTLTKYHKPLSQYDLDFNPVYETITGEERMWLEKLGMDVYIPIGTSEQLDSFIAIGPKTSGLAYQPNELELMQTLADQTIVALQNARLYSELGAQNSKIHELNIDLTEQNERLEIMDKVKSDFITIASHELRTPLTQVKGYTDILAAMNEDNSLTPEQTREIIGHVNRATIQLEKLLSAMLDASQLDVDGMQLTFVETNLDMIIRLATDPFQEALRTRQIKITTDGLSMLPPIQGDFRRLVQAFANLIGNAIKYTPDTGSIRIEAQVRPGRSSEQEFIEIIISDTGIGIDIKYHELIFEKFFRIGDPQLHSTGNTKFKGAGPGLGLPIAKGVIEAHNGQIWVESPGVDEDSLPGSQFYIILPIKSAQANGVAPLQEQPAYLFG